MNEPRGLRLVILLLILLALSACVSEGALAPISTQESDGAEMTIPFTPMPTRPVYNPGQLVDYIAQTGDTLPALAVHFNTSVAEILEANPFIPASATTLPASMPMRIPIYHRDFWGSPYQILPDSQYVNGPAATRFDTAEFLEQRPGWLRDRVEFVAGENRSGAEIVDYVASNFSISPRLLLALLEYHSGALSQTILSDEKAQYPLGYRSRFHRGVYLQLAWAANHLNNGYYGWRSGTLSEFERKNGRLEVIDPWQNAATVALQTYFNRALPGNEFDFAISPEGFARTYRELFGDPWLEDEAHIPGSLEQPGFLLPFEPDKSWAFTGGPHTGWGTGDPLAALDFAPPSVVGGCQPSDQWVTAVAAGLVVRSETGIVVLDLDGDGDDRTGWAIFYLHVGTENRVPKDQWVEAGESVGHPSCEGGTSTGTHVHLARKYNGEWIIADSPVAFVMEGWVPQAGAAPYEGSLTRFERRVVACECSTLESQITSTGNIDGAKELTEEATLEAGHSPTPTVNP